MYETHVEHPIRFVEYKVIQIVKTNKPLPYQVKQSSRSSHKHIHPSTQSISLRFLPHTAKYHGIPQRSVLTILPKTLIYLYSQLTSRSQHKRLNASPTTATTCTTLTKSLNDRYRKCRRFARTRLRTTQQIIPLQHHRNSLCLYRRRFYIPLIRQCLAYRGHQSQIIKCHFQSSI